MTTDAEAVMAFTRRGQASGIRVHLCLSVVELRFIG